MPHISLKMLEGRTPEQKKQAAQALAAALQGALGVDARWVSVSVEDYTPEQWQEEFKREVTENAENVLVAPAYDPKELL